MCIKKYSAKFDFGSLILFGLIINLIKLNKRFDLITFLFFWKSIFSAIAF